MLKVSLSPDRSNAVALSGFKAQPWQNLYIFWDFTTLPKLPLTFQPNGHKEGSAPIDYNGGTPVAAYPATFPAGTQTVSVVDSSGFILETATFAVEAITPPPTGKEPVNLQVTTDETKMEVTITLNGRIIYP